MTRIQRIMLSTRVLTHYCKEDLGMDTDRALHRVVPLTHALEHAGDEHTRHRVLLMFGGVAPRDADRVLRACGYKTSTAPERAPHALGGDDRTPSLTASPRGQAGGMVIGGRHG